MFHLPCRRSILKGLFAAHIILLLLWFSLPSTPPASPQQQPNYIQDVLRRGSRLTTIHVNSGSGWDYVTEQPQDYGPRHTGIFLARIHYWQLHQESPNGKITLQLGQPTLRVFPDVGHDLDLTTLAVGQPQFVKTTIDTWHPAGDQSWPALPNFCYADAALIFHQWQQTWQRVRLRVLVPQKGTVQIWRDMPGWESFDESDIASIDDTDRNEGLIASFMLPIASSIPGISLANVNVSIPDARLPSQTYLNRYWILCFLTPLFSVLQILVFLLMTAGTVLLQVTLIACGLFPIYVLLTILSWKLSARDKSFKSFTKRFWMTRIWAHRLYEESKPTVWGPSGPLDEIERVGVTRMLRANPLTHPFEFFKSNRPLDDLLVTFECTRWMVLPLWSQVEEASTENSRTIKRLRRGSSAFEQC